MKRKVFKVLGFLPFVFMLIVLVPVAGMASIELSKLVGLRPIPVPVVGTGSMYPSLYWAKSEGGPEDESQSVIEEYRTTPHLYRYFRGVTIFGHTLARHTINHGAMVAFKSDKTAEILTSEDKDNSSGFIKRVIGVPGDTIELRDGFTYRNGELVSEPYIASPRSTYGGTTLKDCEKFIVPPDNYFVLGDNRKVSSDSRYELGLVQDADINFILPQDLQSIYTSLWRDTTKDRQLMGSPSLSSDEFLHLVNTKRLSLGLSNLTLKSALLKSSTLRAQHLLDDDSKSYSMQNALSSANYSNIVLGEFISHGHFTAQELLENLLFNAGTSKQILNQDYSDLGISAVNKEVNGCPTQIIVGHLGGYLPASYDQSVIDSWRSLGDNLRSIIPSWEAAKDYESIDQTKLSMLLALLHTRLSLAEEIVQSMEKRAWLTPDQQARIKADQDSATRATQLTSELNQE